MLTVVRHVLELVCLHALSLHTESTDSMTFFYGGRLTTLGLMWNNQGNFVLSTILNSFEENFGVSVIYRSLPTHYDGEPRWIEVMLFQLHLITPGANLMCSDLKLHANRKEETHSSS